MLPFTHESRHVPSTDDEAPVSRFAAPVDAAPKPTPSGAGPSGGPLSTKYRSTNCAAGAQPTTMFSFLAHDTQNESREFQSFMLSCQTTSMETPDAATTRAMKKVAREAIEKSHGVRVADVALDAHGVRLGMQGTAQTAKALSKHRMASNCGPDYNLNKVTAYNRFECRYLGKALDSEGKEVYNPFQTWRGTLPSCDDTIEISDGVQDDIRKLAWDAAGGEAAKMDVNQFMCRINSIPTV